MFWPKVKGASFHLIRWHNLKTVWSLQTVKVSGSVSHRWAHPFRSWSSFSQTLISHGPAASACSTAGLGAAACGQICLYAQNNHHIRVLAGLGPQIRLSGPWEEELKKIQPKSKIFSTEQQRCFLDFHTYNQEMFLIIFIHNCAPNCGFCPIFFWKPL